MQEEITKVEIILENCELITINGKYIGEFVVADIKQSIERVACNYIGKFNTCSDFIISINRKANNPEKRVYTIGDIDDIRKPFDRLLKYPDITSIDVYFKDKTEAINIRVPWNENNDTNNSYQKTYMNKFGDLFIVVSKTLDIDNAFDLEKIEDKDTMNFIWEMYE